MANQAKVLSARPSGQPVLSNRNYKLAIHAIKKRPILGAFLFIKILLLKVKTLIVRRIAARWIVMAQLRHISGGYWVFITI